jgi:hypothetical protein
MPYLHRFTRVTISGTAFGGAEEWSTGFNMGEVDADATMPDQGLADAVRDAWRAFMIKPTTSISAVYEATLVKVSSVGTDGKSNAADTVYANFPVVTKGVNGERHPAQIALVATLLGVPARGVASKGRMYLPGVFSGVGLDGKISTQTSLDIATNLRQFLFDVAQYAGTPNVPMLASPGSLNRDGTPRLGGSGPKNSQITAVKVGNVFDTQRRRRNGFAEAYQTVVL